MDMLGPASLRSRHPSKSSLKTYGGRRSRQQQLNTRTDERDDGTGSGAHEGEREDEDYRPPARQLLDWDRLERDRRARLERQAKEQERLAQAEDETAFLKQDVDLEALLYSDHEDQFEESAPEPSEESSLRDPWKGGVDLLRGEVVPSTQESDDDDNRSHYSQTRGLSKPRMFMATPQQHPPVRTRGHRPVVTPSSHTADADLEFEMPRRASTAASAPARTSILSGRSSIGEKSVGRVSFSFDVAESRIPEALSTSQRRKVMIQEEPFFKQAPQEEDEDEEEEPEDEVLFRTPSFDILKKMRELPKPNIPEPRANPFGFRPLSLTTGPTSPSPLLLGGQDKGLLREFAVSTPSPEPTPPTIDIFDNPFMSPDSPTVKRAMDILRKREQQLKEIQTASQASASSSGMDLDKANETRASRYKIGDIFADIEQDVNQQQRKRPSFSRETTPERISTTGMSRSVVDESLGKQDESEELALGKRISSIEITPRRLQAKQRKTAPHDSDSPTRPLGSRGHFSPKTTFDNVMEDLPVRPLNLFLDRDIPKDEDNSDLDLLFTRSRNNRRSPPPRPSTSTVSNKRAAGVDPNRLLWPPKDDQENKPEQHTRAIDSSPFTTTSSTMDGKSTQRRATFSRTDWLKSPSPQPAPLSSVVSSQDDALIQKPLSEQQQPQQPPQPSVQQLQQYRPIRSLRRPQAVLVSDTKKAAFKPTLLDLLSICDQQFFDQFEDSESAGVANRACLAAGSDGSRKSKAIVDFDAVLPKCMAPSLTKIGEASYSEVYTVDLPIHRHEQRFRNLAQQSPDGTPNLFQSPRLNTYVKESADDDLNPQDMSGTHGSTTSGGRSTKLVMKVLPFHGDDLDALPSGLSSPMKGARRTRSRGAVAAAPELLALEDIYREATVSTQIMHGWKGFIGSFGYPKAFLSAWDRFRKENGTESDRPDHYTSGQLYCIILLPYGGVDLEHCSLTNWRQAWAVLAQVAASLESKEQAPFWFEHRDLHWGNILVKGTRQKQIAFSRRDLQQQQQQQPSSSSLLPSRQRTNDPRLLRNIPTFGIVVQMIDFTLARVQGDKGNLIYMDLEKDEDLFKGHGDYQFDIYRKMRRQIGKDWTVSCPKTNLFSIY
ncbi:Serine/threonine-protein kinase haspin [Linnemannia hyalina]|uniref:Serine/threonine-protein kinase haspin n=1 Tax=Linnemannia hyalina TaxID=64524 RepID=A0A9P7Y165_9FUNG|nr:Serine/threonine-protein kinase haspin [Linnemannia hyalina]